MAHRLELRQLRLGQLGELPQRRPVALLLEARHGLPNLADRAACEREGAGVHDSLVAEVERAQAELLPQRPEALARAESGDPQAARLGEYAELSQQAWERLVGPDRVTGDQQDAGLDALAEEGAAVGAEEVVLVAAELEVGERVRPVPADELARGPAHFQGRKPAGSRERPEQEVRAPGQCQQPGDADCGGEVAQLVVEGERPRLPEERVAGLAQDGHEAMKALRAEQGPALAILDWMMPEMDGLQVCRRIRESEKMVYVIMLTSCGTKENIVEGLHAGADDYLIKPFDKNELLARIQVGFRILELHGALAARVKELEGAAAEIGDLKLRIPL